MKGEKWWNGSVKFSPKKGRLGYIYLYEWLIITVFIVGTYTVRPMDTGHGKMEYPDQVSAGKIIDSEKWSWGFWGPQTHRRVATHGWVLQKPGRNETWCFMVDLNNPFLYRGDFWSNPFYRDHTWCSQGHVKPSFQPVGKLHHSLISADKLCLLRSFSLRLLARYLRYVNQESCFCTCLHTWNPSGAPCFDWKRPCFRVWPSKIEVIWVPGTGWIWIHFGVCFTGYVNKDKSVFSLVEIWIIFPPIFFSIHFREADPPHRQHQLFTLMYPLVN